MSETSPPLGLLLVGLSGSNSLTLLTSLHAHSTSLTYKNPSPITLSQKSLNGCITQTSSRGVGPSGLKDLYDFKSAESLRVHGWDIFYDEGLGDHLINKNILPYDLTRQVKDHLNQIIPLKGIYSHGFIGDTTANWCKPEEDSVRLMVDTVVDDINSFKEREGCETVVIVYSGSVERDSSVGATLTSLSQLDVPQSQLNVAPSLIYALAASLTNCPFVNTASQNTLSCPLLTNLTLGTDFKCGQTKFKTSVLEYIRQNAWTPLVVASCNHLGNNDIRNLSKLPEAFEAKLRKKHDIFGPYCENELDHKVSVLYTPHINDDKRDYVEYTSSCFLGCEWTMVTYTRCSDSVLCAPMIIDAAVLVEFFLRKGVEEERIKKAMEYLFKVPETKGDPGFGSQMRRLRDELDRATKISTLNSPQQQQKLPLPLQKIPRSLKNLRIVEPSSFPLPKYHVPGSPTIITAGLACLDTQLLECDRPTSLESITSFSSLQNIPGGSVSNTSLTLSRLSHGLPDRLLMPPPTFSQIIPLYLTSNDPTGQTLNSLLTYTPKNRNLNTSFSLSSQILGQTSTAILPIYTSEINGDVEEKAKEIIKRGAAIVCVTLGDKGCVVTCGNDERFAKSPGLPPSWAGLTHVEPLTDHIPPSRCNTNGAGDAFLSGFLTASMLRSRVKTSPQVKNSKTPFSLFAKSKQASTPAEVLECHSIWEVLDEKTKRNYSDKAADIERSEDDYLVRALHENGEISLEQACRFATKIAGKHVDMDTRGDGFVNIDELLE
ncbi:hypothetical protein TrVE_jg3761 [Triparma verrucosa]|uniref:inositol-3-phosphate synthase n=1 Tax=Triparma verrucosa TaxID=1606542 RepID=A0A9W7ELQ6_9STRA|nr:hypothetical protein TrVE_jg3761 [Triparma verrucosa]